MRSRWPGWVPNQHGAWAMLASPLLVGILAGGPAWVHLPLTAFWFAGYLSFFATGLWLRSGRRARYWPPVRAYVPVTAALGVVVVLVQPRLIVWAPAFALPLGIGLWAAAHRRDRDLLVGLSTVVGSSLMTVVAYAAGPGDDGRRAALLAAVQLAYFAGTVFYVKSAIRERDNQAFLRASVALHAAATAAMALLSWWLVALFAVLTARASLVPPRHPTPKAIGLGEVAATVAVAVVSLLVL